MYGTVDMQLYTNIFGSLRLLTSDGGSTAELLPLAHHSSIDLGCAASHFKHSPEGDRIFCSGFRFASWLTRVVPPLARASKAVEVSTTYMGQ
jgi:hypothetical protein